MAKGSKRVEKKEKKVVKGVGKKKVRPAGCDAVPPGFVWCLKCGSYKEVKELKLEILEFLSKRHSHPMKRAAWRGLCASCGTKVRKFAPKSVLTPEMVESLKISVPVATAPPQPEVTPPGSLRL
jgi:hypothetical protein